MLRYVKIFVTGLIVIIISSLILLIPRKILISKIECNSVEGQCPEELMQNLKKYEGKNLIVSRKGINYELKKDPSIAQYHTSYKLLNSIAVSLLIKKPAFEISKLDSHERVFADKEGIVLKTEGPENLPRLIVEAELPKPGIKLPEREYFALLLLRDLQQSFSVKAGRMTGDSFLIELPGNLRVIFPLEGERETLMGSLVLIQNELKTASSQKDKELKDGIKTIDLRYKNPVLRKS